MTKKKDPKDLKPKGAKSSFSEAHKEQARFLCKLGATDKDLASFFKVTEQTINNWKEKHPDFFESLKDGKKEADNNVEKSLYLRAVGYEHPEDKIFNDNGIPLVVPTIKHYPPDVTACIFWLKNRRPEQWRDKQEIEIKDQTAEFFKKAANELKPDKG